MSLQIRAPSCVNLPIGLCTYSVTIASGGVSTGTAADTVASVLYLWHPSSSAKRVDIWRVLVHATTGSGGYGSFFVRMARITAENGTPGGTAQTPAPFSTADAASTCTARSGAAAPTRGAELLALLFDGSNGSSGTQLWEPPAGGLPLVLREGQAEGLELRSVVLSQLTSAATVTATIVYTEYTPP